MKNVLMIITALLFNVFVGGAIAAATGFNPLAVISVGSALSLALQIGRASWRERV